MESRVLAGDNDDDVSYDDVQDEDDDDNYLE